MFELANLLNFCLSCFFRCAFITFCAAITLQSQKKQHVPFHSFETNQNFIAVEDVAKKNSHRLKLHIISIVSMV